MPCPRPLLVPLVLSITLLCLSVGTVSAAARADSGCVLCHTDRDMLTRNLDTTEKRISSLIEGPG